MARVKVVLNSAGIQELLKSDGVTGMIAEAAQKVASNAGDGFEADVRPGKFRAIARIQPVTKEAKNQVYRNNVLLKALHK
jgi:hypothetical protein